MKEPPGPARENRLLAMLDRGTYASLALSLQRVKLDFKQILYEPEKPIDYAYFPISGVVSLIAHTEGTDGIEVATVGDEGVVGLPLFLGADLIPGSAVAQIAGEACRIAAETFRQAVQDPGPLTHMLHRYTQALMVDISQGSVCNRMHSIEERCARWLLQTHDRVHADEFQLTQEFLSKMLGVRRASVNLVASMLQRAGFIRYTRGRITILDRSGLQSASCPCYGIIRREYDRMLRR